MGHQKKTICIAGHRFYTDKIGGVELQTRYIGETLAKSGWKVAFLTPSLKGKTGLEKIDGNTCLLWYPHFSFRFQMPKTLIKEMLDSIQPSIFYQRGRGQLTKNEFIVSYAQSHSIPHIFALSTDKDLDNFYEVKMILESRKPIWKKFLLTPYEFLLDISMWNILKKTDFLIAQHEDQVKRINKKLKRSSHLIKTIHPEIWGTPLKSDRNIILWVTNYRPWKRGELFLELAKRCPKEKCHFVMVYGKTKEAYTQPMLKRFRDLDNVTIYKEMSLNKVEELMEKSILFINTSKPSYEGFPNTFIQAWLRETPTISLNVDPGGVINREKIGMCSGSFEQLVKDVKYLVKNESKRMEMGKRAREYAEKVHGFKSNAEIITDFFNAVIDNKMSL